MIEQVLYRRTVEQGYNEYCSRGLSKEEAHRVNVVMDMVASDIGDLGSGADSPFMFYPFDTMHRYCLAIFQREFSRGRSNSVNHGLLIEDTEYKELVKKPEELWGFTNKNFISRKLNHREEMFALNGLDLSHNAELSKDSLFEEYKLNNEGFLKFLNAIYTSLSKNKNYTCGIRIDNSKDANKVMRHLGYLIMSMLPYELRDKISFCSRSAPYNVKITVQILQGKAAAEADVVYDMETCECSLKSSSIEVTDFYLNDLLSMSDDALKEYFGILATFKEQLKLSSDSEVNYVVSKLLKLSQDPSLFALESAEAQFAFINDVFSLPATNFDLINSIVARLLSYIDSAYCVEAFNVNFGLYRKLNPDKESDRKIMDQVEKNLVQNYDNATTEDKKQLFKSVFKSEDKHDRVRVILEKFVEINALALDSSLVDEYIKLYEEYFATEWKDTLFSKIVAVFKQNEVAGKEKIWNQLYHHSTNPEAGIWFVSNILHYEDETFHKVIFNDLVTIFIKSQNHQLKELCYKCISNVVHKEDDDFRLKVINKYNDLEAVESSLWIETYKSIQDYQSASKDVDFLKCLKNKYYESTNPEVCDLYLEYIEAVPSYELENIITRHNKQVNPSARENHLLYVVVNNLINDKKKISVAVLKVLTTVVKDEVVNEVASYISSVYLSSRSESNIELYEFLETRQKRFFDNAYLNKENMPSYDSFFASKLDPSVIKDESKLTHALRYLDKLKYHDESFTRINALYQKFIDQKINTAFNDYERYKNCKALCDKLNGIRCSQFGDRYYSKLKARVLEGFWKSSDINTFDYEHCDIYKNKSALFDQRYRNHENHVLAEKISGMMDDRYVDWDKVYSILLSKEYISKDAVRNKIVQDFTKQYRDKGFSTSEINYIAFDCVNKNNLKMDFTKLFDSLQKYHHRIDDRSIRNMKVFGYIDIGERLKKKIYEYKNFQSDSPTYGEVVKGLLIEQIAVLVLLVANNILRYFAVNMTENIEARNIYLLCNYSLYIVMIIAVAVLGFFLMRRANMRVSTKYDNQVFLLLIGNIFLSAAAVVLSVLFTNLVVCLLASVILMLITIILNLWFCFKIGVRKGDDV